MTPGNDIAYVLFLLGIGSGLLLAGISLLFCFCLAVAAVIGLIVLAVAAGVNFTPSSIHI
jgi:hypothetical protein